MSVPLLKALTDYYDLVDLVAINPTINVPSELDFIPTPGDDLESMIWVLTYAILLHHQESLEGPMKALYKLKVVDQLYGSLSYSGLARERKNMLYSGSNPVFNEPEKWIADPVQRTWFRRAMTLVADRLLPSTDDKFKAITFDSFDALCDEFITD